MKLRVNRLLFVALAGLAVTLLAPFAIQSSFAADEKPASQRVSPKMVKPLKAAQEAMQKEDWDTAIAKTLEAKAVPDQTAYDQYQVNEFLSFLYMKKQDYANAAAAYDGVLASGFLPADQLEDRTRVAATLNFQLKNYPKAVEYSKRWVEVSGGSKPEPYVLLGQSYYVQEDYTNAVKQIETGIDVARKAGKPLNEQWLQLALSSYAELDDAAGIKKSLVALLREHPTPKYWDQMFTIVQNQRDSDDRTTMNLYRLMFDVGQLKRPDDYVELAQYTLMQEYRAKA
jgi:tetratricopeptide (TPR) repeat protein